MQLTQNKAQCPHLLEANFTKSLQGRKIYKDQCVRCFREPNHSEGLFLSMKCFNGFCFEHLQDHYKQYNQPLFLRIRSVPKNNQDKVEITKLAIGVQGGAVGDIEYDTKYTLFCKACNRDIPQGEAMLQGQIKSVINTDSPFKKQALATWQAEVLPCQHTLTLQQQPGQKNLQTCSMCNLSTNLWLCLTCGSTGCGRKNWDGSGGNNHAIDHFESTAHPLVVKLGTITAEGQASLYCYTCNNEVRDDLLADHLNFFGIDVGRQKKTEKTVEEINLELNLNFSLSKLVDKGDSPVYGPQLTGINNIGNSCYLNSVVQTLNCLPEFRLQYFGKGMQHVHTCKKIPAECFYCQVSKVFWGLNSGVYSERKERTRTINDVQQTEEYQEGIKPYDFKTLFAGDHAEFTSNRQQDALEYLQWVFDRLDREESFIGQSTTKLFNYKAVNRLVCQGCGGYKAISTNTNEWKFPVPPPTAEHLTAYYNQLEKQSAETKKAKECEDPEYDLKFEECLAIAKHGDMVSVNCPKCMKQCVFMSHNYFETTPRYLLAIPNRFIVEKWVPKKLNALINMPQEFEVSEFLLKNAPPVGEKLSEESQKKYSQQNVAMLVGMGFTENSAKRALIEKKNDMEQASNWIMENMDNPAIHLPVEEEKGGAEEVNPALVASVMDLGFDDRQAKIALLKNGSNPEAAVEWLFGCDGNVQPHAHLLEGKKEEAVNAAVGSTMYLLKAVIIHLGKSVHSGHYVAYVRRGHEWVLFNDEKVTLSPNPVLGKGYIYVYEGI